MAGTAPFVALTTTGEPVRLTLAYSQLEGQPFYYDDRTPSRWFRRDDRRFRQISKTNRT
jgi:hypothetical protein